MKHNANLPLLLLAFTIAVVIKLSVLENEQLGTRLIDAQITYGETSPDIVVFDRRIDTVRIEVRGPASDLNELSNAGVVAAIPQGRRGPVEIALGPDDVNLPPGDFEVVSIDPDTVPVQIEPRAQKTVEVRIELVGEPAAGARSGDWIARPARVEISGPRSHVERVDSVRGQVSLEGHARTFEDTVTLNAPPHVQVAPRRIVVEVAMEEPELSISVENIQDDGSDPS